MSDPVYIGPTGAAIAFVEQGWDFFGDKSVLFMNKTLEMVEQLINMPEINLLDINIPFPDVSGLVAFAAPVKPTLPEITFNDVDIPAAPDLQAPVTPNYVDAPAFDVAPVAPLALPTQPAELSTLDIGDAPTMTTLVLPDAPTINLPADPTFYELIIPDAPNLVVPTFNPDDPGDVPNLPDVNGATFTEGAYTRAILGDVIPAVQRLLTEGGLPPAIEFALFQRSRNRVHRANTKARHETVDEWDSRGFTLPPGALVAALDDQTQKAQDEELAINRDLTIQFHQEALVNVRTAVQQGIALEGMLIQQHSDIQTRALQAARLVLDVNLGLYNAQVAGYNAKISKYQADAEVFKSRIAALQAEADVYRAQIDGQRALAGINESIANAYKARIEGINAIVDIYTAQVQAIEAQARIEATKIDAFRARVQAMQGQVQAYEAQWNAYTSATNAQMNQYKTYEIGVSAFATRTNAWAEGERVKSGRYETDLKRSQLTLDTYRTRIQAALGRLQVESTRIDALARQSQSLSNMYVAEGQIEGARSEANTRAFTAQVEYYAQKVNASVETMRARIQNAQQVMMAKLESLRGAATALAQLAAAAMSAVNFSAGVSGSGSINTGYSYSLSKSRGWSWGGELPDTVVTGPSAPDDWA